MRDKLLCLFVVFAFIGFLLCRLSSLCHTPSVETVKVDAPKVASIDELYKPKISVEEAVVPKIPTPEASVVVEKMIDSRFVLDKTSGTLIMEGTIPSEEKDLIMVLNDFCHTFSCVNNISIEPLAKDALWMGVLVPIINEFSNQNIEQGKLMVENNTITLMGNVKSEELKQNIAQSIDLYANGMKIENNLMTVALIEKSPLVLKPIVLVEQNNTKEVSSKSTTIEALAAELVDSPLSQADQETQKEIDLFLKNNSILFKTGLSAISEESFKTINTIYGLLEKAQSNTITIEGHTDSRGDVNQNKLLSQQRADAIKGYLVEKGLDESKLTAVGYGSEIPLVKENTQEAYRKNRRVEFHLN